MATADVLIVSLSGTTGLREADEELAASMRRAGATVAVVRAEPVREWRTFAGIDLAWALSARRAARRGIAEHDPRAIVYSSTTAALLAPRPGAIRFDAPAAGNRPARHGIWQRPVERRRFADAPLLLPWSPGALGEAPARRGPAIILPVPVEAAGPPVPHAERDVAAITYGANPHKKGLDIVLATWRAVREEGEELVVAGIEPGRQQPGVHWAGRLPRSEYRALLRRSRAFVTAPRREDYGIAQLEALADGCVLVTTAAPGPYAALPIARALDPRTVGAGLATGLRTAIDDPAPRYAERAAEAMAPFSRRGGGRRGARARAAGAAGRLTRGPGYSRPERRRSTAQAPMVAASAACIVRNSTEATPGSDARTTPSESMCEAVGQRVRGAHHRADVDPAGMAEAQPAGGDVQQLSRRPSRRRR